MELTIEDETKVEEVTDYLWDKYYSEDEDNYSENNIHYYGQKGSKLQVRHCVEDYIKASKVNGFFSNYEDHGDDYTNLTRYWVVKIAKALKLKYKRSLDKKFSISIFVNLEQDIISKVSLW